jgi:hypothetical protein
MNARLKLTGRLHDTIVKDLVRPHPFALERVGFVSGRVGSGLDGTSVVLLTHYHAVADDQYIDDPKVGARIGPEAMTWSMQAAHHGRARREGIFHIHLHEHCGPTGMSAVDEREIPRMIPGLRAVSESSPHGIIILSRDHGVSWIWLPGCPTAVKANQVSVIGAPIAVFNQ